LLQSEPKAGGHRLVLTAFEKLQQALPAGLPLKKRPHSSAGLIDPVLGSQNEFHDIGAFEDDPEFVLQFELLASMFSRLGPEIDEMQVPRETGTIALAVFVDPASTDTVGRLVGSSGLARVLELLPKSVLILRLYARVVAGSQEIL